MVFVIVFVQMVKQIVLKLRFWWCFLSMHRMAPVLKEEEKNYSFFSSNFETVLFVVWWSKNPVYWMRLDVFHAISTNFPFFTLILFKNRKNKYYFVYTLCFFGVAHKYSEYIRMQTSPDANQGCFPLDFRIIKQNLNNEFRFCLLS